MIGEVYNQSICIVNEVAYLYYIQKKTAMKISEELNISQSTVSRLLKRAINEGVIEFRMPHHFNECIQLAKWFEERYPLKKVLVVPVKTSEDSVSIKKKVALEGARYLQRIIKKDDILGLSWGGTMFYLIQYLNPCLKITAKVVTMHGSIAEADAKLDVSTLVSRAAMAFGGQNISIKAGGLFSDASQIEHLKKDQRYQKIEELFKKIDISVSGVGAITPKLTSPLGRSSYMKKDELKFLLDAGVCCDIMLRFIKENGKECESQVAKRTLAIDLETYKGIPHKIVVVSGIEKVKAVQALLNGGLLDVLIIDQQLAKGIVFDE